MKDETIITLWGINREKNLRGIKIKARCQISEMATGSAKT